MKPVRTIASILMLLTVSKSEASLAAQEKLAATMLDVQAHFATCFQPPAEADDETRITFYFTLNRSGQIFGRPRVIWQGSGSKMIDQKTIFTKSFGALRACLPIPLDQRFASTVPGKVYFLQFQLDGSDSRVSGVIMRPYGSEGYPLVDAPEF